MFGCVMIANDTSQDLMAANHNTRPTSGRRDGDGQLLLPPESITSHAIHAIPEEGKASKIITQPMHFHPQRPPLSVPSSSSPPLSSPHPPTQTVPHPRDSPLLFLSDYGTPAANLQINGSDHSIGDYVMNLHAQTTFQDPSIRLTGERVVKQGPGGVKRI